MTTAEDQLFDDLYEVSARYCLAKGLRTGIERIALAMQRVAEDEAADIRRESQSQTEMELRA